MKGALAARRRPLRMPAGSPELRRRLAALLLAVLVLLAVYLLWLRNSGLVRVERVSVSGLTTEDAPRVRRALVAAAREMTTLNVDERRLREAVGDAAIVDRLEVRSDFPRTLRIAVVERHPAAMLVSGGGRVAVADDGTLLRGLPARRPLPEVRTRRALPSERLEEGRALTLVRVAGGAPRALVRRLRDVRVERGEGIVVRLRSGPDLVFGSARRLRAKWLSAARVLADPASRGASYVDLRLPDRPAAGGLAPATEAAPGAAPGVPAAPPTAAPAPTPAAPGAAQIPGAGATSPSVPSAPTPATPPGGGTVAPAAPAAPVAPGAIP